MKNGGSQCESFAIRPMEMVSNNGYDYERVLKQKVSYEIKD